MKKILIPFFLLLSACGARYTPAPLIASNTQYPSVTPSIVPTETPIPTSTIDYQSTAIIAQQTADEARRVNAQITAEYEQRIQEQMIVTAQHEQNLMQIYSWTAIAAGTSIPLTATQQAVINTQIPQQQLIIAAQITATYQAPTQMIAMERAENVVKFAKVDNIADIVGKFSLIVFAFGFVAFLFRFPIQPKPEPQSDPQTVEETIIWLRNQNDNHGSKSTRLVVPCTPEQLTELAELAANGERTFGINRLENNSRTLRSQRDTLYAFRRFLLDNGFAFAPKPGEIALNDEGEAFLNAWFETHKLPTEYEFTEQPESAVADSDLEPLVQVVPPPRIS